MNKQLAIFNDVDVLPAPVENRSGFRGMQVSGPVLTDWQLERLWTKIILDWLFDSKRPNTQRNYLNALGDFFTRGGNTFEQIADVEERVASIVRAAEVLPWLVGQSDIHNWKRDLETRIVRAGRRIGQNYSVTHIQLMMSAVSSFYKFAENYTHPMPDGSEFVPYPYKNPFNNVTRPKASEKKFKRTYMSQEQVARFLNVIPNDTVTGKMHFALMLMYLTTGRRNSEVRLLQWGDFNIMPDKVIYTWAGKNHVEGLDYEMPIECWSAICEYLKAAGRFDGMQPTDYIFTANGGCGFIKHMQKEGRYTVGSPITSKEVARIVKQYAKAAGLDYKRIGVHSLRHTVAHGLRDAGARIEYIKDHLAHRNLATTMIYEQQEDHQVEESVKTMMDMFGATSAIRRRGIK